MLVVLLSLRGVPETTESTAGRRPRVIPREAMSPKFRRLVAPMAPWVFVAPAIAFALLPSVIGAGGAVDGIALTAVVTSLTALAGVLIQPAARRLETGRQATSGGVVGLIVMCAALGLAALTADLRAIWLLVPCALLFGSAYGLCLIAGLLEVGRIAPARSLGGMTAAFYALTYTGFAAPFLFALAAHLASYAVLLLIASGLAVITTACVHRAHVSTHTLEGRHR